MRGEWKLLARASSRTAHTCREPGERRCRGCRWFEVSISRRLVPPEPAGVPEYRVDLVGRSSVPGEVDRPSRTVTTSPAAVVDTLALGALGSRYVPKVSRRALYEAGDVDGALAEALSRFDHPTNLYRR